MVKNILKNMISESHSPFPPSNLVHVLMVEVIVDAIFLLMGEKCRLWWDLSISLVQKIKNASSSSFSFFFHQEG
jgi:hypothetical protein